MEESCRVQLHNGAEEVNGFCCWFFRKTDKAVKFLTNLNSKHRLRRNEQVIEFPFTSQMFFVISGTISSTITKVFNHQKTKNKKNQILMKIFRQFQKRQKIDEPAFEDICK